MLAKSCANRKLASTQNRPLALKEFARAHVGRTRYLRPTATFQKHDKLGLASTTCNNYERLLDDNDPSLGRFSLAAHGNCYATATGGDNRYYAARKVDPGQNIQTSSAANRIVRM